MVSRGLSHDGLIICAGAPLLLFSETTNQSGTFNQIVGLVTALLTCLWPVIRDFCVKITRVSFVKSSL